MPHKSYEKQLAYNRKRYQRNIIGEPFKQKCSSIQGKCRQHGLPFNLTPTYLKSIWTGLCGYSDTPIDLWSPHRNNEQHAELDRIIPVEGYIQSNVIWVSRRFNRIKSDGTADEHRLIAERLDAIRREYGSSTSA